MHITGEQLGGHKFQCRRVALAFPRIQIDTLMPGDFGGVYRRADGELRMVPIGAAGLLGQAIDPGGRLAPEGRTLLPSPLIAGTSPSDSR